MQSLFFPVFPDWKETIIIIISDTFVNEVLQHIHNLPGIEIYIHCSTRSKKEADEWMKKYECKVSVFSILFFDNF